MEATRSEKREANSERQGQNGCPHVKQESLMGERAYEDFVDILLGFRGHIWWLGVGQEGGGLLDD